MTGDPPAALLVMNPPTFALQFRAAELARLGAVCALAEPVWLPELDSAAARRRLTDVQVLLTSWGVPPLTPGRLADAPRLRLVLHAAGSVRGFLGQEVFGRGIQVSTAADANAVPVAEFTLAAVIMAGKKAPFLAARSRQDVAGWAAAVGREDLSNHGRTVGLVGFSRIGRRVADRLRLLDTEQVLVADPFADPAQVAASGARLVELPELLRRSQILSLHAPLLAATRGMIGGPQLALLPDGATVINTARGGLVDHDALARECARGRLDAILDVTDPEPLPAGHPLLRLPNVMITPHVAGSLGSETRRMSNHAIDELERWVDGRPLRTPLTADAYRVGA